MKSSFKQLTAFVTMLLGYGYPSIARSQSYSNNINQIRFATKEELEILGLPSRALVVNESGAIRYLNPGESVLVKNHEEDNSISFTTFDKYSFWVDKNAIQSPRNVGDGHD